MYGKYPKPKKTKASGGKKKLGMGGKAAKPKKAMKAGGRMKKKSC